MVAVIENTVCVKIIGRADFTLSLDLKKLIGELCQKGFAHFIFQLSDCQTMDSTFLGVLSGIGLDFAKRKNPGTDAPLELLNPNPRIAETLENLGVVDLFSVRYCPELMPGNFETLERSADNSKVEVTRNCYEAHQILMALRPENVQKFKDVTQFLADDLKRLEAAGKK